MREDANTAYRGTADTGCASCSEEGSYRDNRDSRSGRDTNGSQAWKEVWRIAALRTVGSLGLVSFLTVMALRLFIFRGLAWQALLYLSLGGFLGSGIATVWGMEAVTGCLERRPESTSASGLPQIWPGAASSSVCSAS